MSSRKRTLCVGMCVLDLIHVCDTYPVEDTDKRSLDGYWQRGGNASNNCTVLRKLGCDCEFFGMISSAPAFQFLYDDFKQKEINYHNCPKTDMNPPFSSVILNNSSGSRTILHVNKGFPTITYEHFCLLGLRDYNWIHFEGRNVEQTKKMMDLIKYFNRTTKDPIKISVELEKLDTELFQLAMRADIVFVGKDLAQHMGWSTAKEAAIKSKQLIDGLKTHMGNWPVQTIICPWGSEVTGVLNGFNNIYSNVNVLTGLKVTDTLGAGDTFVAGVIYALNILKKEYAEAVIFGNQLAGFKIERRGFDWTL